MTLNENEIEPELSQPPPRRVRRRKKRGFTAWILQFLVLLSVLGAIGLPLWATHMALVRLAGPIVTCEIVDRHVEKNSDGNWVHQLIYRTVVRGKEEIGSEIVDKDSYLQATLGSKIPLQLSPLWPGYDSILRIPGRGVWGIVWGTFAGSTVVVPLAALMLWHLFILPARKRQAVRLGVAVKGTLTQKTAAAGEESSSYFLLYQYSAVSSGFERSPTFQGKELVEKEDWDQVEAGDSCTVLYDPKRPSFSALYPYGEYEVVL